MVGGGGAAAVWHGGMVLGWRLQRHLLLRRRSARHLIGVDATADNHKTYNNTADNFDGVARFLFIGRGMEGRRPSAGCSS